MSLTGRDGGMEGESLQEEEDTRKSGEYYKGEMEEDVENQVRKRADK